MLTVNRAASPPLENYLTLVRQIFSTRQFTNHGPMVCRFEQAVSKYLSPECGTLPAASVMACANGTLSLELALRALGLEGKRIITTPFTYVATLSAILASGCIPFFVDIDPTTLCLTPEAVKRALSSDVGGVMPVHIYGNACDVAGFADFSRCTGIPVIYDAAHAFGACYGGQSLLSYGDCAAGSFHATKVMHTCEGGCVVSHNEELLHKIGLMRAFGHVGDTHIMPGINAKMSELHAAMGLCMLPYVQEGITARKELSALYDALLAGLPLQFPAWSEGLERNYAYYPVIFESEEALLAVQATLNTQNIAPRRYFYPSLTTLPYVQDNWKNPCPVAESVSRRVLCLPLYVDLQIQDVEQIAHVLCSTLV